MEKKDIDNILKTNKKLDWVKRLYEKDTPSIVLPGQEYPSTHYMESSDNLVYPTIIRNADGKLEYLGNKARDYAIKTNTAIKLNTEEDAAWFGKNYKQGTDVLKEFKLGGNIMKKKKFKIPKYAPGGYMTTGDTVQLADSNMLQGYDSGLSSIPDYSQQQTGMSTDAKVGMAGGIMGGIGSAMPSKVELTAEQQGLEKGKDQLAQSNPFIGMFRGIEKMANGIGGAIGGKKGEETMRSITDPFQNGLGSIHNKNLTPGQKALQFLPFGNFALPEMDGRFDKQFETKNAGSNLNFGNVVEMALGGLVTNSSSKDFKQFNTESHEEGGQFIDKNKNPTNDQNKAVAEIEKKENSYKDYIFSDTLLHKNEITFAKQADKINRKYKDREDVISKNSLDIELTELMKKNEKQRQLAEEQNQQLLANVMRFGGDIKEFKNGGKVVDPIYTDNPKDKRLQAYNDSLSAYNLTQTRLKQALNKGEINDGKGNNIPVFSVADRQYLDRKKAINTDFEKYKKLGLNISKKDIEDEYRNVDYKKGQVKDDAIGYYRFKHKNDDGTYTLADYKKPVQPVIYKKKEEVKVPIPKKKFNFPDEQQSNIVDENYKVPEQGQGYPLPDYLTQTVKTPNGMKIYKRKDNKSAWVEQYKNGGIIKKYSPGGPLDPDYFTKLMQQQGVINYGNTGPIEDRSYLGPVNKIQQQISNYPTINKPLFDYTDPIFHPQQDVNGIDIEPANDNYGAGIGVDNSVKQSKTITSKNKPSALEIAGYGIKGAELLGHAIQAFKKPDLVNPVYNPEENAIKSIMKNRSVDVQSILNELDLQEAGAKQNIANNSTSVGVMQANLQKLNANNVNAITKTKFDEQLQNNQYRADEATVLGSLGQQKVAAQNYAEDLNARAKGNVQNQRDKFLKESIGGLGDFLLKKDYVNKENAFQANILNAKGINFTATDYKNWNKAGIDIVKFDGELESETDTAKRKELMDKNLQKIIDSGVSKSEAELMLNPLKNKYIN